MKYAKLCVPIVLAGLLPFGAGSGSEMPSDPARPDPVVSRTQAALRLEQTGLPAREAAVQASALDRTELAELAQSDPDRKGGDAIVAVAVIAAIVMLVYILMDHMDRAHK